MMLPGTTVSPQNFFTPKRFDSESRPFLDEPPAFLCAMIRLLDPILRPRARGQFSHAAACPRRVLSPARPIRRASRGREAQTPPPFFPPPLPPSSPFFFSQ